MGFTLSAITRLFTQYRYNKISKDKASNFNKNIYTNLPPIFKDFNRINKNAA